MERNELEKIRLEKIERMRAAGIEPYPTRATQTHTTRQALQAFVEGRIKELEVLLAMARVIDETAPVSEAIQVGSTVTIQEEGNEPETYTIVGAAEANPAAGRISNESPLGKSLLNKKVGDKVQVDAPAGAFVVTITKVD